MPTPTSHTLTAVILLAAATPFAPAPAQDQADRPAQGDPGSWPSVLRTLGMLRQAPGKFGASSPESLARQLERELTPAELTLLERDDTGPWKTFSDDLLTFEVPDDPLLKIEPFTAEENPALNIVGGAIGTTDSSFRRVYRITFSGGAPYGLVLVTTADWFDEGICMCGPIAHRALTVADGNLIEMSQLPGSSIKKFQVINDTHRAILFEWTHSSIRQKAYARIGASLRLNKPSARSREDWAELTREKRDASAVVSWLRPGMQPAEVTALLGQPTTGATAADTFRYVSAIDGDDGERWRSTVLLDFQDGQLQPFRDRYHEWEELQPTPGSLAWAQKQLPSNRGSGSGNPPELNDEKAGRIYAAFLTHAPEAQGYAWRHWCGVASELAEAGFRNADAAKLAESRFAEPGLSHHNTWWVLHHHDNPRLADLSRQRLQTLLTTPAIEDGYYSESSNLFNALDPGAATSADLVRQAVTHATPEIRRFTIVHLDLLPADEAAETLKRLLQDPEPEVRYYASDQILEHLTVADRDWLNERADREPHEHIAEAIRTKAARFRTN